MIIITEVSKDLTTKEKTTTQRATEYMFDWMEALKEWGERFSDKQVMITTKFAKKKPKITFVAVYEGMRYKMSVEWFH